jgi:hypothetical protein
MSTDLGDVAGELIPPEMRAGERMAAALAPELRLGKDDLAATLTRLSAWRAEAQECVESEVMRWHSCFGCTTVLQLIDGLIAVITERARVRDAYLDHHDPPCHVANCALDAVLAPDAGGDGEGGAKRLAP